VSDAGRIEELSESAGGHRGLTRPSWEVAIVSQPDVLVGLTGIELEGMVKFSPGLREISTTEFSLSGGPASGRDTAAVVAAVVAVARG